jgi:hypothetical protein
MIYININGKQPPESWCRQADICINELKRIKNYTKKNEYINSHKIWNDPDLKNWLESLSYKKCWYSEAREIVSPYDVDHFRPKLKVLQSKGNPRPPEHGYWWLAYDWKNYRISGIMCNRLFSNNGKTFGKSDYFPLKSGSPIAKTPKYDLNDEIVYLLDPTNPNDPPLLTFDDKGFAMSAAPKGTWQYNRVMKTIELLNLDNQKLVEERTKIREMCREKVIEAESLMYKQQKSSSVSSNRSLETIFNELRAMISPKAELSSAARSYLLSSGILWAMNLANSLPGEN